MENSCVCKYGYTGSFCEAKLQCNDFNCVNNGTCELELLSNKTFCSCNHHAVSNGRFEGVFCEKKAPCHVLGSCFNGGLCQRDPYVTDAFFCKCLDGFIGPFCEERTSCRKYHAFKCGHGGTCNSNMCSCVSEYTGYFCQLQVTPGMSRNSEDCLSVALESEEKKRQPGNQIPSKFFFSNLLVNWKTGLYICTSPDHQPLIEPSLKYFLFKTNLNDSETKRSIVTN